MLQRRLFWLFDLISVVNARIWIALSLTLFVILMCYGFFAASPALFPRNAIFVVEKGWTIAHIGEQLKQEQIIRSPLFFSILVSADGRPIQAGAYAFTKSMSVWEVSESLLSGSNAIKPIRVTFPEGSTAKEMADILLEIVPGFEYKDFINRATPKEGYLFPDTYIIAPGTSNGDIIAMLEKNFDAKIETLKPEIDRSKKTVAELVIMASLLEKEARTYDVRRTIAGILWNRIDADMPLQVDAVFGYIKGTKTFHPSYDDLEIESPYNTYRNNGLPPGAIGNPGLEAIRAAATPLKTKYFFYLTDRSGVMRYATNFEGHVRNRALYLD
jgi:UPF0755 protein